jgi:hypothetical protein
VVTEGKTDVITIKLDAAVVKTTFTSEPPGAKVFLVVDGAEQALGPAPASATLDATKRHEVRFEKTGYVPQTKPVELTGEPDVTVAAVLEREQVAAAAPRDTPPDGWETPKDKKEPRWGSQWDGPKDTRPNDTRPKDTPPKDIARDTTPRDDRPPRDTTPKDRPKETPKDTPREIDPPVVGGTGKLRIIAKPSCAVFINGSDTGKFTPLRDYEVKSGTVTVTLVNNEYNIREKFTVTVSPGETETVKKDYMDRIQP